MDDNKGFPYPPRRMEWDEMLTIFFDMVKQIKAFAPDEIIAVNRSGYSFAMWTAQVLNLPLGSYWPDRKLLIAKPTSKKLVFVDDNILKGETFLATLDFMKDKNVLWCWAVVFSDWHTPENIRNRIIQGKQLDYFAIEPFPGSMKVSADYGVRARDEQNSV